MAAKLQAAIPSADIQLVGGGKGDFIVTLEAKKETVKLWDKRAQGDEFPDENQIVAKALDHLDN